VREGAPKFPTQHYPLVVPLLIEQLTRISLVKILVILLASTRLEKRGPFYSMPYILVLQLDFGRFEDFNFE